MDCTMCVCLWVYVGMYVCDDVDVSVNVIISSKSSKQWIFIDEPTGIGGKKAQNENLMVF